MGQGELFVGLGEIILKVEISYLKGYLKIILIYKALWDWSGDI
jgi:hypothetical protein